MIKQLIVAVLILIPGYAQAAQPLVNHVILISVDGLRPDAISALGLDKTNAFYQMMQEGAATLNARTDDDYTTTIPNHTCMITGYPVMGLQGHHVIDNTLVDKKVHDYAGRHVYSIFDVLSENNRRSAMLASKLKFNIYKRSYPIDMVSLTNQDDARTVDELKKLIAQGLPDFVFMHLAGTDRVGHQTGWDMTQGSAYMNELSTLNGYLHGIIEAISATASLKESTVIIITTDHGGEGKGHADNKHPRHYTIPFIIWGKPVAKGIDLYRINSDRRKDPSDKRIGYKNDWQPIRNGDAANLSLSLLGLPLVEGSSIGYQKPLKVSEDQK